MITVTQVLSNVGIIDVDAPWYTEEARDRGSAVHYATELYDEGALDWSSIQDDEKLVDRVDCYSNWRNDSPTIEIKKREFEVIHPKLRYVGHPDILAHDTNDGRWMVIDIKPPGEQDWHGMQLSAYQRAILESDMLADRAIVPLRYVLHLGTGGRGYKLVPKRAHSDWTIFQAALTVARFKEARS